MAMNVVLDWMASKNSRRVISLSATQSRPKTNSYSQVLVLFHRLLHYLEYYRLRCRRENLPNAKDRKQQRWEGTRSLLSGARIHEVGTYGYKGWISRRHNGVFAMISLVSQNKSIDASSSNSF